MAFDPVVVSAADGPLPRPSTSSRPSRPREPPRSTSSITHTDVVDDAELLELVELEIRDLAEQNGLAVGSITRGGSGIYGPPS